MLTIHVCQAPMGLLKRRTVEVPWTGATFARLLAEHRDPRWSEDAPISVLCGASVVDDLDVAPPDDVHVVIAPSVGGEPLSLGTLLLLQLAFAAVNIAIAYLTQPDLDELEAGDETSPTYSFTGVSTSYGTGFRVPIVYGEHGVGGQAVSTEVTPIDPLTNAETFKSVLVLSEGPVHSIGGVASEVELASPDLPSTVFPQGILVNDTALVADAVDADNTGAVRVSTRLGTLFQQPMRGFEEPRSTVAVGAELAEEGDAFVAVISSPSSTFARVQVDFPQGLYKQTPGGVQPIDPNGFDARFVIKVRAVPSSTEWDTIAGIEREVDTGAAGKREAMSVAVDMDLTAATVFANAATTGFEVRVERTSPSNVDTPQEAFSDAMVFSRIVHGTENAISYSNRALCAVQHRGTERLQGGRPNFLIPMKGRTVRVWDPAHGLSTSEYFEVPESGDTYEGIWTYPPGRNPAWIAADLLTAEYGLGNYLAQPGRDASEFIDWQAFRNLADYCDQSYTYLSGTPDAYVGAMHQCDIVLDSGIEAWAAVMAILRTCRAVPMLSGRTVTVRYQYRDAHGRGTNTVPDRAMVDVVGTSSVEDFTVQMLPKFERPNVLVGQFLNANKNWQQDEIVRENANAAFEASNLLQEQARRRTVRMFGITNPDALVRELDFMHAVNDEADRTVRFRCSPEQIAVEPHDIIGVQHDVMRPLTHDDGTHPAAYVSARTNAAISGTSVTFSRTLTVPVADVAYNVTYKATDGDVEQTTLTPPAGETTIAAGDTWTAADTVTCPKGAVFAFGGTGGEDIEQYVLTSVQLDSDDKLACEALKWTPGAFDV